MADRGDTTFVREVNEEIRRERLQRIWERYGLFIVAAAVALLLGIIAYKVWEARLLTAREVAGARFEQAVRLAQAGRSEDALKEFQSLAANAPPGYQALARLRIAAADGRSGKSDAAVAAYEAIAKDQAVDSIIRDFASFEAANLRVDKADWTEIENRLTPLIQDTSAWRAVARETLGLAAYKAGKLAEARKLFEQILSDRRTPQSISERTLLMLSLLTDAEAAKAGSATAKPQESPTMTPTSATPSAATPQMAPAGQEPKASDQSTNPAPK